MHTWKTVLTILTCNVVLMSAGYTMLIPFLPLYLRNELGADPENINMWTGAIFAVSFAVCAVMAPIWGRMSDSKGRKLMLVRSSAFICITYLLGGLVQTPLQLFMVRVLQGFAAGMWPASLALMSAYAPKSKVGVCMGVLQSANICGGIMGPLIGGTLANSFGIRTSFFVAFTTLLVITAVTIFFIKEPPREQNTKKAAPVSYRGLMSREGITLVLLAGGLTNMVILLLQPIMTLYIEELMQSDENLLFISGVVFSLSGISGAIAAPLWGRKGQSKGFYKTLVTAMSAAGLLIALQCLPSSLMPFAVLQFCVGLGFSGIFPSANALLINLTSPLERGTAFGMLFSAQQVGGAVGPMIGGLMATFVNLSSVFFFSGFLLISMAVFVFFKAPEVLKKSHLEGAADSSQSAIEKMKEEIAEEIKAEISEDQKDRISQ